MSAVVRWMRRGRVPDAADALEAGALDALALDALAEAGALAAAFTGSCPGSGWC